MWLRSSTLFLVLPILLYCSAPALAHTWACPTEVRASTDGTFQFDVVLTIEGVPVLNGYYLEQGTENVADVGLIGDGFCAFEVAVGSEIRMTVHGTLTDAEQPGTVHIEQYVCGVDGADDGYWERDVAIAPAVVAVPEESFGMLKARFAD